MGRQILQLNQKIQAGDGSDMASVISTMINFPIADRRRRRSRFNKQNIANSSESQGAATSDADYDEHFKIDRILYNCFGDMMSITRTTQIELQLYSNADENVLCDAQNEAIENFLAQFIQEQSNEFIEALANLNLSAEMSTPSVETVLPNDENRGGNSAVASGKSDDDQNVVQNRNLPTVENAGDRTNASDKSSVYSIQRLPPFDLNDEEIIEQTPSQRKPSQQTPCMNIHAAQNSARHSRSIGSHVSSSGRIVSPSPAASAMSSSSSSSAAHLSNRSTFSRQATPYQDCDPPSFSRTSSQSSVQSSGHQRSNFSASQKRFSSNDLLFDGTSQNDFDFESVNVVGSGDHTAATSHSTFAGFDNFSQGFQSLKNDFNSESWSFGKSNQGFSQNFFGSERQDNGENDDGDDDGFEFDDKHNENDFGFGKFTSQPKRPNLQNIRKNAASLQLSGRSATNSNSGNCSS